jgi:protein involved in polysaccharide export with SLBB domain
MMVLGRAHVRAQRWIIIAILVLPMGAQAQVTSRPVPAATVPSAEGRLDLTDPKVRERLRAAGIDPEELVKMMAAAPATSAISSPTADGGQTSSTGFPPVSTPPGAKPVFPVTDVKSDSIAVQSAARDSMQELQRYFGYEIFALQPSTFEPLAFGPVAPEYLIGPGDEIVVHVWGAQEVNARAVVNREGFLILPEIGQVSANGYTLKNFREHLENRLARVYSGIQRDGRGRTFVEVSLGKLRSIQVFVLGDVKQPGGYNVSATSTALNALYYAGGPTLKGSLRNVRVLRNNQQVHKIDLYDYIAHGNRSQDVRLESGDVLFVPPVAKRVTVIGEVHKPAMFELRDGERFSDLVGFAGGLTTTAFRGRVQIERIVPFAERSPLAHADRKVMDLALHGDGPELGSDLELRDGDIVRVFRIRDILRNTVALVGTAVYKPGTYELRPGMTVADLVQEGGGLLGEAYTGWAHLVRTRDNKTRELQAFNLAEALARRPEANLALQELDEVQVFSIWDIRDPETVSIQGMVRKPGVYDLLSGMTITDLIVRAGGMKESAYRMRAEVSRIDPERISEGNTSQTVYVAMADSLSLSSEASKFPLKKNDIVFIREIPNWALQENVVVTGEVKFPGTYSLTSETERLSSVIARAGGLDATAYLQAATFIRRKDGTGRMAIDFQAALRNKGRKPSKYDLVMAAGDSIHIPREPKAVKVTGQVGFPSSVLWEEGRDMGYYIDQAGGTLDTADKDKITVVMANGRVEKPGFMRSPKPDAGAVIVVPAKPQEKDHETLKNMAQIMSILSGAATTIYLISRTSN